MQFTTKKVNESAKKKEEFYWDEKEVVEEPATARGRTSISGLHMPHRLGNASGAEKWRKVKDKEQAMRILGIGSNVNEAEGAKPVGISQHPVIHPCDTGASFLLLAKRHPRGFQEENQGEGCDKEAHSGDARCPRVLSGLIRVSPKNPSRL